MAFKDYFEFLSTEKYGNIDYVVMFKREKVDINRYPELLNIGSWKKYGLRGYRVICKLSRNEFIELIVSEVGINKGEFNISRTVEFVGL